MPPLPQLPLDFPQHPAASLRGGANVADRRLSDLMLALMAVPGREGMKAQAILRLDFWESYWTRAGQFSADDRSQFEMARSFISAGMQAAAPFRSEARRLGEAFACGRAAEQWPR